MYHHFLLWRKGEITPKTSEAEPAPSFVFCGWEIHNTRYSKIIIKQIMKIFSIFIFSIVHINSLKNTNRNINWLFNNHSIFKLSLHQSIYVAENVERYVITVGWKTKTFWDGCSLVHDSFLVIDKFYSIQCKAIQRMIYDIVLNLQLRTYRPFLSKKKSPIQKMYYLLVAEQTVIWE